MSKNLFTSLFALLLSFVSSFATPMALVRAEVDEPTVVTTPFEFCEYFTAHTSVGDSSRRDCSSYPDVVGVPISTDAVFRIEPGVNVVLKDMNITYTSIRGIFSLMGGKITNDGGTYTTAGSCLVSISYNNYTGTSNAGSLQIISGDFIAERSVRRYSQTPICLNYPATPSDETRVEVFRSILAPNSYYAEFGTMTEISLETNLATGVENFAKDYSSTDEITYINRTKFSVREHSRIVIPEPTPEEPEPETPTPEEPESETPTAEKP
ncbi:hypothetical protein IJG96_01685 [Candidatus Saccharibacteria bacterium]|nr:hypothetical protein [Candidatus Saccharibacteria bacterium]